MYFFLLILLLSGCQSNFEIVDNECQPIKVRVSGAVREGSYELYCEATFKDLLEIIELASDADVSNYRESMPLYNNDEIVIRRKQELQVSINYGTIEELVKIKGIGEKTAQKIIDYRNEFGLFERLEDIMKVKGIGEKKFLMMKDYITL